MPHPDLEQAQSLVTGARSRWALLLACAWASWSFSASSLAQQPEALGSFLLVGQAGGSVGGRADNYPASDDDGSGELGSSDGMPLGLEARLGTEYLPGRWFSASLSLGASRWHTDYFERIGRDHSYTFDLLLVPKLRIPLSARRPGFALFAGVGAGPAVSVVSEQTTNVRVREHTEARPGFAVAWTHGADFQVLRHWGVRAQIDVRWTAVRYRLERRGPSGPLASTTFDDLLFRPVFLVGIWYRP